MLANTTIASSALRTYYIFIGAIFTDVRTVRTSAVIVPQAHIAEQALIILIAIFAQNAVKAAWLMHHTLSALRA